MKTSLEFSTLCIFAGSNDGVGAHFADAAQDLGHLLGQNRIQIVYGGAKVGLMGRVADAALAAGGEVVGVIPQKLASLELAHEGLTDLHIVDSMHARKLLMSKLSDGFIALPGGIGTLEEMFEVWTWTQLGIHSKPIGMLNTAGYFDALVKFLDELVQKGFLSPSNRSLACVESESQALLNALATTDVDYTPKWVDKSKNSATETLQI